MTGILSRIPLVIIAFVAVVGGVGTGMAASQSIQDLGLAAGAPEGEEATAAARETWLLDELVVNLTDPAGARLLRVRLAFEGPVTATARCTTNKARLLDDFIRLLSDRSVTDIEGSAGKDALRADLLEHANAIIGPEKLDQAFFHSFLVY